MVTAGDTHIRLDEQGAAWIDDTRIKVVEVVRDHKRWEWSAETIHEQYPHLNLAQVHAALAYYYDHQQALDDELDRRSQFVEEMRNDSPETPGRKKLRDLGLRP